MSPHPAPAPHPFPPLRRTVYCGTFIHLRSRTQLCVREHALLGVDQRGRIVFVAEWLGEENEILTVTDEWIEEEVRRQGWGGRRECGIGGEEEGGEGWVLVRAPRGDWFFPGFVDTHIHACQYPNSGIFGESTLLCWLEKYTFPLESSLYDPSKAKNVYSRCVAATLRHGTTTAAYYATRDAPSTNILAKICLEAGQRAFIGRCNMDSESNPETYRDASSTAAIKDTQKTITEIKRMDPDRTLICPIITPRYAPSCTSTLLAALGTLAHKESLPIQTHISENPDEIALVAKLFPDYDSYAAVYDGHRLLTPRTVLGHGVHLSPAERALIKQKGAKISHCPVSNSCISSGLCPVRQLLDEGIEVGLGTDVSGGYSPSVLAAAREAAIVSRLLSSVQRDSKPSKKPHHITSDLPDNPFSKIPPVPEPSPLHKTNEDHQRTRLTVEECLHLATVGGARCLGLEHKIGAFEVGMEWDAQLVHLSSTSLTEEPSTTTGADHDEDNPATLWGRENWSEKMAKWMFCGDDRNTRSVWVRGRLVHQRD